MNSYAAIGDPSNANGFRFTVWMSAEGGRETVRASLESGKLWGVSLWPAVLPTRRPPTCPASRNK